MSQLVRLEGKDTTQSAHCAVWRPEKEHYSCKFLTFFILSEEN